MRAYSTNRGLPIKPGPERPPQSSEDKNAQLQRAEEKRRRKAAKRLEMEKRRG